MAIMLGRGLDKAGVNTSIDFNQVARFIDDRRLSTWARPYIYYLTSKGIMHTMQDNRFVPLGNVTREEAMTACFKCLE